MGKYVLSFTLACVFGCCSIVQVSAKTATVTPAPQPASSPSTSEKTSTTTPGATPATTPGATPSTTPTGATPSTTPTGVTPSTTPPAAPAVAPASSAPAVSATSAAAPTPAAAHGTTTAPAAPAAAPPPAAPAPAAPPPPAPAPEAAPAPAPVVTGPLTQIFTDKTFPTVGKQQSKVLVAQFFDYKSKSCKANFSDVEAATKKGNAHFLFIDLPILSLESMVGAKAALAAGKQGKYFEMHKKLMTTSEPLTDQLMSKLAVEIGLNEKKFENDRFDEGLIGQIQRNINIAKMLKLKGAPAFVIGTSPPDAVTIQGSMSLKDLLAKINHSHKK